MAVDPALFQWCTPRQREVLEALDKHGSHRKAAKALGVNHGAVDKRVAEVKRKAAAAGYSPDHDMVHTVPEGFTVKGTSTLYGHDGQVKAQWVKTRQLEEDRYQALHDAFLAATEDVTAKKALVRPPKSPSKDLMCVIPIGDPHVGMYSWAQETGADYDLDIAERLLCGGVDHLVGSAPEADEGVIINLGDFYHSDNAENRTARSGHALDVDTRWAKVLQVGHAIMIRCIDRALERFKTVHVFNEIGNHDDHSAVSLALHLAAYYRNEPRVRIDVDAVARKRHYHTFGACLLGTTHGNDCKPAELAMAMPNERAEDWAKSRWRKWFVGHIHSQPRHEIGGVMVEYYRTLAAKDAWAYSRAFQSDRSLCLETWHRENGPIGSNIFTPMLLGAAA